MIRSFATEILNYCRLLSTRAATAGDFWNHRLWLPWNVDFNTVALLSSLLYAIESTPCVPNLFHIWTLSYLQCKYCISPTNLLFEQTAFLVMIKSCSTFHGLFAGLCLVSFLCKQTAFISNKMQCNVKNCKEKKTRTQIEYLFDNSICLLGLCRNWQEIGQIPSTYICTV